MTRKNMMKTGLAVAAAMVVMTGCGNSSTTETTVAQTETTQAVSAENSKLTDDASLKLGEYKGLTHTVVKDEVTDGEVEAHLHGLAAQYPPKIKDRVAEIGDTANIDYEGTIDGESFSGGTAYSHDLELGSGSFIEGFEEGVAGMMPGTEKDLELVFPEDYYNADLAGKSVVFHVTLNYLTNPETITVDDDMAKRALYDETATLDMLRDQTRAKMELNAEVYYYLQSAAELLEQVIENSEIVVDPDAFQAMHNEVKTEYSAQAALYGMTYKDFLSVFMNTTPEQVEQDAEASLKEEMVMNAIIEAENIVATDEQKAMIAKMNGCESVEQLVERYGDEQAEKMYGMYAGTYYLISNAVQGE